MCYRTRATSAQLTSSQASRDKQGPLAHVWPLHPLCVIALVPFLPTWLYLNRGYTVWFHHLTIAFLLTNSEFLCRFLILQGTGITLGWYAAICNDLLLHNRFCHILYMNMPAVLKSAIVDEQHGAVMYNITSLAAMCLSHALDTLLHPGLVYLLWRAHSRKTADAEILTWPVIISTYLVSRLWSVVHVYHNTGQLGFFYYGYDVYHVHDLDSWLPAYVAEGVLFTLVVLYKVAWQGRKGKELCSVNS